MVSTCGVLTVNRRNDVYCSSAGGGCSVVGVRPRCNDGGLTKPPALLRLALTLALPPAPLKSLFVVDAVDGGASKMPALTGCGVGVDDDDDDVTGGDGALGRLSAKLVLASDQALLSNTPDDCGDSDA